MKNTKRKEKKKNPYKSKISKIKVKRKRNFEKKLKG